MTFPSQSALLKRERMRDMNLWICEPIENQRAEVWSLVSKSQYRKCCLSFMSLVRVVPVLYTIFPSNGYQPGRVKANTWCLRDVMPAIFPKCSRSITGQCNTFWRKALFALSVIDRGMRACHPFHLESMTNVRQAWRSFTDPWTIALVLKTKKKNRNTSKNIGICLSRTSNALDLSN